jgi:hypothetical protein
MTERETLEKTRRLMGALLRLPPKLHSEMKLNKPPKPQKAKRKKRGRPPKES